MSPADDRPDFPVDPFPDAGPRWEPATPGEDEAFLAAVDAGVADTEAGRTVPGADVTAWIRSLGTTDPLPRPRWK